MSEIRKRVVYWIGDVPKRCQVSNMALRNQFVDGRIPMSTTWAIMHPSYFKRVGGKLGMGHGQLYQRQDSGEYKDKWLKIEG